MRLCSVEKLEDGILLGKSIYDVDGRLLLKEGSAISSAMNSRIKKRGYNYIYIMEEGTEEANPQDVVSDQIRLMANMKLSDKTEQIRKAAKFGDMSYDKAVKLIEDGHLKKINFGADIKDVVGEIIKDVTSTGAKSLNTLMLKSHDTYYMDHAINTSILATIIAKKYRLKADIINALALGTFLHDIGKTISEQLDDPGSTGKTKELYRKHPKFGYDLLSSSSDMSPMVTQIVFQHHEHQNGCGFPSGLSGDNISPVVSQGRVTKGRIFRLAEICCVANAYDKMVLNPNSDVQMDPQDVIKRLIVGSGTKYNKDIVKTLLLVVPSFQTGVYVKVMEASDVSIVYSSGVVVNVNEEDHEKPVIIINKNKFNKKVKPHMVDTSELKHIQLKIIL